MPYLGNGLTKFTTADDLTVSGTSELKDNVTVTGDVTASGTLLPTGDTAAGDDAAIGFTSAEGLILTGQGSTSDITVKNDADATVFTVPTGTDDILFPDSAKILMGAGSDLQIYHDGSNSYIDDAGTGDLFIRASNNHYLRFMNGDYAITTSEDGDVGLRYDNSQKLVTTSSGIDVTGVITTDGMTTSADINFGDNDKAVFGAGSDLQIYHDGSNSYIDDAGTGKLFTRSSQFQVQKYTGENMIVAVADDRVDLYYDNSKKLATTSTGVDITGGFTATDGCTITTADNDPQLTLVSTDADATQGPVLKFYRNSASPADNDLIGQLLFHGEDGAGNDQQYANIQSIITNNAHGNESSSLNISTIKGGSVEQSVKFGAGETVFNESSLDLDFRVESDNEANALFVQGSSGNVGIGTNAPSFGTTSSAGLEIAHATRGILRLEGNSAAQALELYGDSAGGTIDARGSGAVLAFDIGGSEKARFDASGRLLISTPSLINNDGAYLQSNGGSNLAFGFNVNYDGTLGRFYRSSSIVGSISVTTSSTAYNTSSDRRLKSNIEDAASASDKIDAIQVRQFDWNVDDSHQDYGLIAQELQPIEPMAVTGDADSDEMMGVDYSKLVPMLIKEIQELRGRVAALEAS